MGKSFRESVFVIVEEQGCPLYKNGDEFTIEKNYVLTPGAKPTCLIFADDLIELASATNANGEAKRNTIKSRMQCGGCEGRISFDYKKEKSFTTLQMMLLSSAEKNQSMEKLKPYRQILENLEGFRQLDRGDIREIISLLEVKTFQYGFPILQSGEKSEYLYILLSGRVEIVDSEGTVIAILYPGDIFGETGLLSGERSVLSLLAAEPCEAALLSQKDFRTVLKRFPDLHGGIYKILVDRMNQVNILRARELRSDIAGTLGDITSAELCQMINYVQKSGRLTVENDEGESFVIFVDGEVTNSSHHGKQGREAFYQILGIGDGRFRFEHTQVPAKSSQSIDGFMTLLLDGLKYLENRKK